MACHFLCVWTEACDDPYLMEEEDPTQCHALESSLWELQVCRDIQRNTHEHNEISALNFLFLRSS